MASDTPTVDYSPLPRTAISTYSSSNPLPQNQGVYVYYQAIDGYLCCKHFSVPVSSSSGEKKLQVPSSGRAYRGTSDLEGDNPRREVSDRPMVLFSPNCVILYQGKVYAFYPDEMGVIIRATLVSNADTETADHVTSVNEDDTNWVDIKAVSYTRLGAIAADKKGNWLFYQSGREAGIREAETPNSDSGGDQISFYIHSIPNILCGTDIATSISSAEDRSFFYQEKDNSIYECRWHNGVWNTELVVQDDPDSTEPEYHVAPLTGLASVSSDEWEQVHCYYLNSGNHICMVRRTWGNHPWGEPTVLVSDHATIPGSRLAAYVVQRYFFVAYQRDDSKIKGYSYLPKPASS